MKNLKYNNTLDVSANPRQEIIKNNTTNCSTALSDDHTHQDHVNIAITTRSSNSLQQSFVLSSHILVYFLDTAVLLNY